MIRGTSTPLTIAILEKMACYCFCLIIPIVYWCTRIIFEVSANHFALVENQSDEGKMTVIYGPGYHIIGYFNRVIGIYSFDN